MACICVAINVTYLLHVILKLTPVPRWLAFKPFKKKARLRPELFSSSPTPSQNHILPVFLIFEAPCSVSCVFLGHLTLQHLFGSQVLRFLCFCYSYSALTNIFTLHPLFPTIQRHQTLQYGRPNQHERTVSTGLSARWSWP